MNSAKEVAEAIADRVMSVREVAESALESVRKHEPDLHAFVEVDEARVLADADRLDRSLSAPRPRSLLGVPFVVKDVIDVAGYPTRLGSAAYASAAPAESDAAAVARMRRAGGLFLGKTATHELALGVVTPGTANPYDHSRVVGGSSGGSAAVVAAGIVPLGLGTDTGGSLRIPASICGVLAVKPTEGLVPTTGVRPNSWTLDVVGALARSVTDASLALSVLRGHRPPPSGFRHGPSGIGGMIVARMPDPFERRVSDSVASALEAASDILLASGVNEMRVTLPTSAIFAAVQEHIQTVEIATYHARTLERHADELDPGIRAVLERGQLLLAGDYIRSLQLRRRIKADWQHLFETVDAVITPTTAVAAVPHDTSEVTWPDGQVEPLWSAYSRLTAPANLAGLPALSVPVGISDDGLPRAVQLIGRPRGEETLFILADRLIEALPTPSPNDAAPTNPNGD